MLRYLLLLPFTYSVGVLAAFLTIFLSAIFRPDTGSAFLYFILDAIYAFLDIVTYVSPEAAVHHTFSSVTWVIVTVLLAPLALVMTICELFNLRSWVIAIGGCALLTVALPLASIDVRQPLEALELHVAAILFVTGAVAGSLYWVLAGRSWSPSA